MAKGYRKERLQREMLRQISEIVAFKMKDPRIGMVTVTRIELAADFSIAKVYVSSLADSKSRDAAVALLNRARGFIQSILRRGLSIRQIPELRFVVDKGLDNVRRVEQIFRSLEAEKSGEEE